MRCVQVQLFSNTILAILDKIMDMNTGKCKKLCKKRIRSYSSVPNNGPPHPRLLIFGKFSNTTPPPPQFYSKPPIINFKDFSKSQNQNSQIFCLE